MKKFELFVGNRYFRSKKSNKFISFITGLSIMGITIGVMVTITVLSVMNGFQNTIRDKIINTGFHIYLTSYGKTSLIYNYRDMINKINENESVLVATPFFRSQVIVKSTMQRVMAIDLYGIEKDLKQKDKSFSKTVKIVKGEFNLQNKENILLGRELANFLDVSINDKVDVISPQGGTIKYGGRFAPIMKNFRVAGIFKTGYWDYDQKLAFIPFSFENPIQEKKNLSAFIFERNWSVSGPTVDLVISRVTPPIKMVCKLFLPTVSKAISILFVIIVNDLSSSISSLAR